MATKKSVQAEQREHYAKQSAKKKTAVYNKDGTPKASILKLDPQKDSEGQPV